VGINVCGILLLLRETSEGFYAFGGAIATHGECESQ